jgi:thiol-disulfide isomerase/thioredoxin
MKFSGLLAAILVVAAAGCARSATVESPQPASALGRLMAATDIDGNVVGNQSSAGATVVVVFASWCQPCRHELAALGEISKAEPRLRVIGLNAYEDYSDLSDEQRLRAFLGENAPWLQVVHADDSMLRSFGGVPKIPTVFVYDKRGQQVVAFRRNQRRPPTKSELQQAITRAFE